VGNLGERNVENDEKKRWEPGAKKNKRKCNVVTEGRGSERKEAELGARRFNRLRSAAVSGKERGAWIRN